MPSCFSRLRDPCGAVGRPAARASQRPSLTVTAVHTAFASLLPSRRKPRDTIHIVSGRVFLLPTPPAIYLAAPDAGEAFQPVMATDEAPTCAVCLEPTSASTLAVMPCCDREGATVAFCLRCIELVCQHGPGNVGRCPKCRAYVKISADGSAVEAAERFATCAMCRQDRQIVDGGVCDACVLGVRHRLRYECQRCGGAQMVGWREGRESAVWFLILASSRVGRRDVRLAVVSTRARVNE